MELDQQLQQLQKEDLGQHYDNSTSVWTSMYLHAFLIVALMLQVSVSHVA